MQVLTGTAKGKKLKVPKTKTVRPTTSRIKKSIFDKLGDIEGAIVLDLFAGPGGLGIEALSRYASHTTFVENCKSVVKILFENVENCGFKDSSTILKLEYFKAISYLKRKNKKFDLIFIDPPYNVYTKKNILDFLDEISPILSESVKIVVEHDQKFIYNDLDFEVDTRKYGGTNISFFRSTN